MVYPGAVATHPGSGGLERMNGPSRLAREGEAAGSICARPGTPGYTGVPSSLCGAHAKEMTHHTGAGPLGVQQGVLGKERLSPDL